VINVFTLVTGR